MRAGAWVVATVVVTAAAPVCAQDETLRADEIVVWGGARDERRLLETPNAVTVIDSLEIERRQPSTYEELLGDVPGVTIEGGPRGISQEPKIRGFQDEQIVLRVDGARQNFDLAHRGRFFTDPEILKRVEVLRGGNSTLYGSGALGGVILLDTKPPSTCWSRASSGAGGSRAASQPADRVSRGSHARHAGRPLKPDDDELQT